MKGRDIAIIVLVVVGVLVLLPLLGGLGMRGGWGPGMMGGGMMGGPWSGGFPFLGGIFWLLILGGIALVVVSLIRREGPGAPSAPGEAPLDILKRRLAKGEITLDEYEALKKELS